MQCAQLFPKHNAQQVVMQPAYSDRMKDEANSVERPYRLMRRLKLGQLVKEAGGATELGRLCDTPKSHISAMLSGARNVGDELATKLERVMDKPFGWMDRSELSDGADSEIEKMLRVDASRSNQSASHAIDLIAKFLASLDGLPRELAVTSIRYLLEAPNDISRLIQVRDQLRQSESMAEAKRDAA